jgi:hypothetical protein
MRHEDVWERELYDKIGQVFFIIVAFAIVCGFIALHVFIIVALAAIDSDTVFAACGGDGLAVWVTLAVELPVWWLICVVFCAMYHTMHTKNDQKHCAYCTMVICCVFSAIIVIIKSICETSMYRPSCMEALRANSAGMDRALLLDLFVVLSWSHVFVLIIGISICLILSCCDGK